MLKIERVKHDNITGHIEVDARVVEQVSPNETVEGALETHGIDAIQIERIHHGDTNEWLRRVHADMKVRHAARRRVYGDLIALQGKTINLEA